MTKPEPPKNDHNNVAQLTPNAENVAILRL